MKPIAYVAFLTLLTAGAHGASVVVTSNTQCTTDLGSIIAPDSCSLADSYGGSVSAVTGAAYNITGNTLNISAHSFASYTFGAIFPPSNDETAIANSSITIDLATSGPLRVGYVTFVGNDGGAAGPLANGDAGFTLGTPGTIPSIDYYCYPEFAPSCVPPAELLASKGNFTGLIPIVLGTDLDLIESSGAAAFSEGGGSTSNFGFGGTLQFFEADGVTPVDVALATPEPATSLLYSIGLIVVLNIVRQRGASHACRAQSPPEHIRPSPRHFD